MEKPVMIELVGLPASGKSTISKELSIQYNTNIHSSDALREELLNDVNNQDNNTDVFAELHKRIKEDLKNGKSIIYDACNISYKRRISFLQELRMRYIHCEKICYIVATPYEQCIEQNNQRDRNIPEHVIKKMYMNFYIPQMYEGFDKINIIWNFNKKNFNLNELFNGNDGLNKIEQQNPHHQYTIGKHCLKCMQYVEDSTDDDILMNAALFHDIGKKFTKGFLNSKGEIDETAHYYQHHLVSAYDSLFYLKKFNHDDRYILDVCNFIQWHMKPFFMDTDKSKNKFINLVGQEFYDKLLILHEADRKAH